MNSKRNLAARLTANQKRLSVIEMHVAKAEDLQMALAKRQAELKPSKVEAHKGLSTVVGQVTHMIESDRDLHALFGQLMENIENDPDVQAQSDESDEPSLGDYLIAGAVIALSFGAGFAAGYLYATGSGATNGDDEPDDDVEPEGGQDAGDGEGP